MGRHDPRARARAPDAALDATGVLRAGESGYVWVHTPALMRGYLDRDDLTEEVVSDGWFVTGDIGLIDERGWLYLRGREREEINKGGMKVYPADVDAVVERFPRPPTCARSRSRTRCYGEDVGVAVVLAERRRQRCASCTAGLKQHLAEHQLPQRWYVLDEIPRTSRGKVSRVSVPSGARARRRGTSRSCGPAVPRPADLARDAPRRAPRRDRGVGFHRERTRAPVTRRSSRLHTSIRSTWWRLLLWIEERTGRQIDATAIDIAVEWNTVDAVVGFVERDLREQ